jgi:hypothetical protein
MSAPYWNLIGTLKFDSCQSCYEAVAKNCTELTHLDIAGAAEVTAAGAEQVRVFGVYSYITHGCVIALKSSGENVNYFIYKNNIFQNFGNYFGNRKSITVLF